MKWATRERIHVDRAASAWLIRRRVDPEAEFVFVVDPADIPAGAIAFDIPGAELSHHHGDCSFETTLPRYDLDDPALWRIAAMVHEADLDDQRYDAPEGPGLDIVMRGLSLTCSDEEILRLSGPVFDGIYEYCRRSLLLGRDPS